MNIKQKITSAAAIAAMMASVVAPASFAATTVKIKNNGALSTNYVKVKNVSSKTVSQYNGTLVLTGVHAKAKTGGNTSSFNVGGENTITTGKATNDVTVDVEGSSNDNTGNQCGCVDPSTNVNISGNGALSTNTAIVKNISYNSVEQGNETFVGTHVGVSASTGGNNSSFNVGGDSSITTGAAENTVEVTVGGSTNTNN